MCNRYHPTTTYRIRDKWGWVIESVPLPRYNAHIGPESWI